MPRNIIIILLVLGFGTCLTQESIALTDIIQKVKNESFAIKQAFGEREIAELRNDFYKSQIKPQFGIGADLPNFTKTSSPVVQPDGSISFEAISQASSGINLYGSQVIANTGTTFFVNSQIQRFDDISTSFRQYNGIPIRFGIRQNLFGFNRWKYENRIQPLLLEESQKQFNVTLENTFINAVSLYFDLLIINQNLEIAKTNALVNKQLLEITEERLQLGKVSRDEKLQLEIELNNASISVSRAQSQKGQALTDLYNLIGRLAPKDSITFIIPDLLQIENVDLNKLQSAFINNRPEIIQYRRQLEEAERNIAQSQSDFGLQASLQASIGLARGSDQLKDIYTDPFEEQQFNVSVQIPILDWGRKKSAVQQMKIRKDLVVAQNEQNLMELETALQQEVIFIKALQNEIVLLQKITENAEERFQISNDRYILGDLDITNLTIAQREKDQAKRNYLNALKSYWISYYTIRSLTGFDIKTNSSIKYN